MASSARELDDKDKRILELIESKPGGFVGTAEVAEELDLTTNGAAYRLKELKKAGEIESRQPSRDEVWYAPGLRQRLDILGVIVSVSLVAGLGTLFMIDPVSVVVLTFIAIIFYPIYRGVSSLRQRYLPQLDRLTVELPGWTAHLQRPPVERLWTADK